MSELLNLGQRLKTLRENINLSQAKVAALLGTTQASINRYENGQSAPSVKVLLWYGDFFDVSLDYIFCRTDQPQGQAYQCEPKLVETLTENNKEIKQFVEMCFDPKSPMSKKLKKVLVDLLQEETR